MHPEYAKENEREAVPYGGPPAWTVALPAQPVLAHLDNRLQRPNRLDVRSLPLARELANRLGGEVEPYRSGRRDTAE